MFLVVCVPMGLTTLTPGDHRATNMAPCGAIISRHCLIVPASSGLHYLFDNRYVKTYIPQNRYGDVHA